MKKLLKTFSVTVATLFALAAVFSATPVSAGQPAGIALSSPTAGSVYYEGDTVNIRFGFQGRFTRPSTTITLSPMGNVPKSGFNPPKTIASNITTNSYNWKVPKITAGNYTIVVRANGTDSLAHVVIKIENKPVVVSATALLSKPAVQVASKVYTVDTVDGNQNVPALIFAVTAGKTSIGLSAVNVDLDTASSSASNPTVPTTAYLYEKATNRLLASSAARVAHTFTFTNIDTVIGTSTKTEFLVSFDMPSNTVNKTAITARLVEVVPSNGASFGADSIKLPYSGAPMLFTSTEVGNFTGTALYKLDGAPTIRNNGSNQMGSTTSITASFSFKVTTLSGSVKKPLNTDFRGSFVRSNGETFPAGSLLVSVIPDVAIASSTTANVTVVFTQYGNALPSGIYSAKLTTADGVNTFTTPDSTNVMALGQAAPVGESQVASAFASIRNFVKSVFGL